MLGHSRGPRDQFGGLAGPGAGAHMHSNGEGVEISESERPMVSEHPALTGTLNVPWIWDPPPASNVDPTDLFARAYTRLLSASAYWHLGPGADWPLSSCQLAASVRLR